MNTSLLLRTLPATALLALPLACGGGGGGGDTTTAASTTQVGQAVLVATATIDAAGAASDTGAGAVTASSVAPVQATAMGMGGVTPSAHSHFAGMSGGSGQLNLDPATCDGADSGTVATQMQWTDLDPETLCVDDLAATLTLDNCAPTPDQSMHGMMGMSIAGSTCDPTAIDMNFSEMSVTTPDGTVSGDFTVSMGDMMFAGDPANLDITGATVTLDGPMQMAGATFDTVDMEMDRLAFHFDDTNRTGDLNGALTVRCNGQAFPMTFATDANGLTLDADGNVTGGQMTVTAEGTAHQVAFNSDGSVDVTPTDGTTVHLDGPVSQDFCGLP